MADLKSWLDHQTNENLVEPNSGLGKAIAYMKKTLDKIDTVFGSPGSTVG
jgi:transposase